MSQKVLLTGANGFLGAHILSQLLNNGYSVRCIVRSQEKADQILKTFLSQESKLDFGIVPDMTVPGAFNEVLRCTPPLEAVFHQASPITFKPEASNEDFLLPAITGTMELLKSIKAHAPSVKRVIYTASCATIFDVEAEIKNPSGRTYTEADWNPITYSIALNGTKAQAYRGSKKFAELAIFKFVEEEKPNFDVVSIIPPYIWGPMKLVQRLDGLNTSTKRIYDEFMNSKKDAAVPSDWFPWYVDVRDLAGAHLSALRTPEAGGERFIVVKKGISSQEICDLLRGRFPELKERTPIGTPGTKSGAVGAYEISNEKAKRILGLNLRSDEDCFVELAKQLLQLERK